MKGWKRIAVVVVVVLAVALMVLNLFAGRLVKDAVNTVGPKVLGVPVSVKNVEVGLLRGRFGLDELVVGNPEGFKTPEAIRVGKVVVRVRMATLFSKALVIDRVYVDGPEITYEMEMKGSNLGAIQKKMAPARAGKEQPKPTEKPVKEARKVQINDFLIENGKICVSTVGMAGHGATIPLPAIHLTDIGKESGGASASEVIAKLLGAIGGTVGGAATGVGEGVEAAGKDAVKAGQAAEQGAVGAAESVGKDASKALHGVEGLFKKK
jgi:hypothetical protein